MVKYVRQNLHRKEILDLVQIKYPMYTWSSHTLTCRLQYFGIQFTDYIGVVSLPSFNITCNGMNAGIMDGWGESKTCLGSRVLIEGDICQAGHVADSRHLFVQYQVR